jgi:hypothetical protein
LTAWSGGRQLDAVHSILFYIPTQDGGGLGAGDKGQVEKLLIDRLTTGGKATHLSGSAFLFLEPENSPLLAFAMQTAIEHKLAFRMLLIREADELAFPALPRSISPTLPI